jgi:YidC/Oxa1 family membrane protein insertase
MSWLAWLTGPMAAAMKMFYEWTNNYGVAIILLTVVVRLLILPLTLYQARAMKKIQEIQPLMKEMQEKYKNQPQELQQKMMELYREHKVNPLSGCLPVLVQLPFLYAIFFVLQGFEYVATPQFLWVADLSRPDRVLAVLTGATMFVQSFVSGGATDPTQKFLVYFFPFFFIWISWNFAAGLALYWVVSTIFGIIQTGIYPGFKVKWPGTSGPGKEGAATR